MLKSKLIQENRYHGKGFGSIQRPKLSVPEPNTVKKVQYAKCSASELVKYGYFNTTTAIVDF